MAVAATPAPAAARFSRVGAARRVPVAIWLSFGYLGLVVFLSIFGGLVFSGSPTTQRLLLSSKPPGGGFWLGTDQFGRDIFARLVDGTQTALLGPFIVAFSGLVVSSLVGIAAGYLGGRVDAVVSRTVDFMFALPGLLVAIVVVSVVGGGYWLAILVLSLLNVQGDIRIVRSAALEQRPLPYVEAARTLGIPRRRIMYLHILPNIAPILIADFALDFSGALVALAGLAFLGLGSQAGSTEWGRMLSEGQQLLFSNPAAALVPGVAIVLLALSTNLIGDWIYDRYAARGRDAR